MKKKEEIETLFEGAKNEQINKTVNRIYFFLKKIPVKLIVVDMLFM